MPVRAGGIGRFFLQRQERSVAAGRRGIDGKASLDREAGQVVRPAGLGARARQALAPEGLHAHYRPDHVAVHICVTDAKPLMDMANGGIDPAVDAQGEAVAQAVDGVEQLVQPILAEAHHMQDWPEHLALQNAGPVDLEGRGRQEGPVGAVGAERQLVDLLRLARHAPDMGL